MGKSDVSNLGCKRQYGLIRSQVPKASGGDQNRTHSGFGKRSADEQAGVSDKTGKQCENVAAVRTKPRQGWGRIQIADRISNGEKVEIRLRWIEL